MSRIYVARSKAVAARMLGDEMMVMSPQDSTLFDLNDTGSAIWQAADGQTPLDEIVERAICANFDIDRDEALRDAETFVRELSTRGIMEISAEPINSQELKEGRQDKTSEVKTGNDQRGAE